MTTTRISEAYLLPVLAAMMVAFLFVIRGFHSDNGSEYINRLVAKMLRKLLIEQINAAIMTPQNFLTKRGQNSFN